MMKICLRMMILALAVLNVLSAQAQQSSDTLEVHFRTGQSDLDLSYANNSRSLDQFISQIKAMNAVSWSDANIIIFGGSSPEGPAELNRRLGEQRALSLRKALEQRLVEENLGRLVERITTVNQGPRWGGLYKLISDSNEPWSEEALKVLRKKETTAQDWAIDSRELELRKLRKGAIWHEISARYLNTLRSSGTAVVTREPLVVTDAVTGQRDTLIIRDTVYYVPEPIPYREGYTYQGRGWALKTNLLPWVTTTPNIQFEHTLGHKNKWSIEVEAMAAWWTLSHNAYANELLYGSIELRRWLGNRKVRHTLSGWHIGLAVGGGLYDLEWKSDGYQGEALNAYINIGYQARFGRYRQWLFDAGLGLGYLYSPYRKYYGSSKFPTGHEEEYDDHLMWQETSRLNWFGATHANISIGYVFGADKPKKYTYEEASPYLNKIYRQAEKRALREKKHADRIAARQAKSDAKVAEKELKARMFSMTKEEQQAAKAAQKQVKRDAAAAEAAAKKAQKEAAKRAKADKKAAKKALTDQENAEWRQQQAEKKAKAKQQWAEDRESVHKAEDADRQADLKVASARDEARKRAAADYKAKKEAEKAARQAAKAQRQAEKLAKKQAKEAEKQAKQAEKNNK